jgi:multiple sugar transport system substrate-binding protein
MKTTRVILSIVLAFSVLTGICFASGAKEGASAKGILKDVDPSGAEVNYWYEQSGKREEDLKALINEFNETNEWGITVKGQYQGRYNDVYNRMVTAIAGGNLPDLVVAYQNQAAAYQVSDALADINPYVKDPKWGIGDDIKDYFEGFLNQDINAQFGGMRLGFPPNRSLEIMYFNRDWLKQIGFAEPPKNWDQFYETIKKATDPGAGKYGYAIRTDASNVYAMIISRGGEIAKKDGSGYRFDTKEMKDSMKFMKKVYDNGYGKKIAEAYGEQTDFSNRIVLFTMGSTAGLLYYERAIKGSEKGEFNWSVAAIPHTTGKPVLNVYGASVSIPKTTPEKQLAAWLFIKWLTQPEQQARWVKVSNYFPVRKSTAESLGSYFAKNPKFRDAFKLLKTADLKAEPPFAGYDEVRDAVSAAFNATLDGADIDQTVRQLEQEANRIHKQASP